MSDHNDTSRDLGWYRNRWEELMDLLPASEPEEVVDQVRELQISVLDEEAEALEEMGLTDAEEAKTVLQRIFERLQKLRRENQALHRVQEAIGVDSPDEIAEAVNDLRDRVETFEEQQELLSEAGFERPEHALEALTSMKEQLDELYEEKEATERSTTGANLEEEGDTFDQLQALMAREERLQRELGVSSPDAVIEMVEGLTDQLEDVYLDRDAEANDSVSTLASASRSIADQLEEEFGVSDLDALLTMVKDLKAQLDALYADRQQLAEHNLNGADDAIRMLESMQQQLESLYEGQEEMSEHGISGVDHALSMIDNMEAQLSELYDERHQLAQRGVEEPDQAVSRIQQLEEKLTALKEEKEALRKKRDALQARFDELEAELGTDDPAAISDLIDSMEAELAETFEEQDGPGEASTEDEPLLEESTLVELSDLDDETLNTLSPGLFGIDDDGTIRRANDHALQWPDVEADDPDAIRGDNFFQEVAPAANNALFRGRFDDGVDAGHMDQRFFYTYVGKQAGPTNLAVRLYRHRDHTLNWIAFRVL